MGLFIVCRSGAEIRRCGFHIKTKTAISVAKPTSLQRSIFRFPLSTFHFSLFSVSGRPTLDELYLRVCPGAGFRSRLALAYTASRGRLGCPSWLAESQQFATCLHGIDNRRRYLFPAGSFRINCRSSPIDAETNR